MGDPDTKPTGIRKMGYASNSINQLTWTGIAWLPSCFAAELPLWPRRRSLEISF
jgi:hypothetical protein